MKACRIFIVFAVIFASSTSSVLGNVVPAAFGKSEIQRFRWKNKTIKIAISSSLQRASSNIKSDSDVAGAIERSIKAWSSVADIEIQTEYSDRQSVSPSGAAGDGVSLITIAQTPENALFFSKDYDSASAKTRIFFNRKGFISEADIVLNPFQQFSTDGTFGTFDIESTLTHEIGHLLGLRHSGVIGSTMADNFAKNGMMGFVDFGPRTLAEADIASIRDLYGAARSDTECCADISGKIVTSNSRPGNGLRVWAEESETGQVRAQTDTASDGTFRLGGLSEGTYSLYWKSLEPMPSTSMGDLGNVHIDGTESKTINAKVVVQPSEFSIQYLGLNGRLADFGISLDRSRTYVLNIGGRNLDLRSIRLGLNTPFIAVSPLSTSAQEFGNGIVGASYLLEVDAGIPPGQYSVIVTSDTGSRTCLIGALSID